MVMFHSFFCMFTTGYLVGGAITILKNMTLSMGRIVPYMMENKSHGWNHQPVTGAKRREWGNDPQ